MLADMLSSPRRVVSFLPTLVALCSLLVPSGWALCIGPQGHVAVEPASPGGPGCCDASNTMADEPSCVPGSDEPCEDIALNTWIAKHYVERAGQYRDGLKPAG